MRQEFTNPNYKTLLSDMVSMIPDVKYYSSESLLSFYSGILDMSLELANDEREKRKGVDRAGLTRYIMQTKRKRLHIKQENRNVLLDQIYETVLQIDGMGRLMGFGLSTYDSEEGRRKVKGCNLLDPEKVSIYDIQEPSEKYEERIVFWKGENKMAKAKNGKKEAPVKESPAIVIRVKLQEAAANLNEVMGLDPEIDLDDDNGVLTINIIRASELLTAGDYISDETKITIEDLKATSSQVSPAPEPAGEPAPAVELPKAKIPKESPKVVDIKPPEPVIPLPEDKPTMSRVEIMVQILKESVKTPMTKREMISTMQKRYGGSDNEAYFQVTTYLRLVQKLGQITDKDGKLSYNK